MGTLPALDALRASLNSSSIPMESLAEGAARQIPATRLELLKHFDEVFAEGPAEASREVEEAYRLRYQVYCLDRGFESVEACPEGMEHDDYDQFALHSLLRDRTTLKPLGTVRLVLPPATLTWMTCLPLADYAPEESIGDLMRLPAGKTAEVSRFAVTRSARDLLRAAALDADGVQRAGEASRGEQLLPYMSLGLIRGLVRLSMQHGITHWCLAAEPSLLRRLRGFGLHFRNSGPLVEHRGLRQICYARLSDLLERAEAERPEFWDILTEGGKLLTSLPKMQAA
jgi:N-acyl amino acid synthase of PEP-CTERM/exosortase system